MWLASLALVPELELLITTAHLCNLHQLSLPQPSHLSGFEGFFAALKLVFWAHCRSVFAPMPYPLCFLICFNHLVLDMSRNTESQF